MLLIQWSKFKYVFEGEIWKVKYPEKFEAIITILKLFLYYKRAFFQVNSSEIEFLSQKSDEPIHKHF